MLLGVCEIFSQAATLKLRQSCMLVCLVHELTHLVIVHVQKYDSCVSKTIVFERSVMTMFETVILSHRDVITLSHVVLFIFSDFPVVWNYSGFRYNEYFLRIEHF